MYIKREMEDVVKDLLTQFKVVLVTGPRQVGKTTMLKQVLSDKYNYVTLDDPRALTLALDDPSLFFLNYQTPLIIDEVQYAQDLFRHVKFLVDKDDKKGRVVLTGSQAYHLMQNVSESLAGRVAILEMSGLSAREIDGNHKNRPFIPTSELIGSPAKPLDPKLLWTRIQRGSMPELQNEEIDGDVFYSSYVRSYIERDVRSLINVKDEALFYKFLISLAARTGQLFNASSVAKDIGISLKTVQSWSSILEASGIVRFIQPYFDNQIKRLIKTPKVFFTDTGLVCHLLGWTTPEVLMKGAMAGSLFETYVVGEIIKSYINAGKEVRNIYFYRDLQKNEIDLLIKEGDTLHPIEIKMTATPRKGMIDNFTLLDEASFKRGMGALICLVSENSYLNEDVLALSVNAV